MTLAELIPAAQNLSAPDKVRLIRVLAEDLEASTDISPLIPHKTYDIFTPQVSPGAAAVLIEALKSPE